MTHDKTTRLIFNKIHLDQIKNKFGYDKIRHSLNEKILKLPKNYFNGKLCADLGCGSTGSGGYNLLKLGAKYCHLLDLDKHIEKPIKKNLKDFNGKFEVNVGSIEKLPYKKNFFDFVLCQGVIHHMKNDLKAFKQIHGVLKKNGKALIIVHGEGGIINDLTMKIIRPKYKNDNNFKKIINRILKGNIDPYKKFLFKNYNPTTKMIISRLLKYVDSDMISTIEDRILSPKYKTYSEKFLRSHLKKIGFKNIYRIKKQVKFNNLRRLLEPFYFHFDNDIARALYGDGIIHLVIQKK
jgi:ubiquinone/menaquinone biosynthesis C-methylase UbiE